MTGSRPVTTDVVLVVVDMQENLLKAIHQVERAVSATRLLLRAAEVLAFPTLVTTQYRKGLGAIHPELAGIAGTESPIDKTSFSCLRSPEFNSALSAVGRKTLLLCGVETHICVLQTALDALDAGHAVHVVSDATSSRDPRNIELGLRRMERAGAVISSTEMAIYELLGASGTPAFKSLLPYFK
jgi:nicotinamidase-related amidase